MTTNNKNSPPKNSLSNIEIYQSEDGQARIEIRLEHDTLWLSQTQMAALFDKDTDTNGLHLKDMFNAGRVDEKATTEEFSAVRQEGRRQVRCKLRSYNLDAVISVGYRAKSKKGTKFNSIQLQNTIFTLSEETLHSFEISVLDFKKCDTNSRVRYNCIYT